MGSILTTQSTRTTQASLTTRTILTSLLTILLDIPTLLKVQSFAHTTDILWLVFVFASQDTIKLLLANVSPGGIQPTTTTPARTEIGIVGQTANSTYNRANAYVGLVSIGLATVALQESNAPTTPQELALTNADATLLWC